MNLTIELPEKDVHILKARAIARGVSAEQYALEVLEQNLAAGTRSHQAPGTFQNLADLLLNSPFSGANLDLARSKDQPRAIDLG